MNTGYAAAVYILDHEIDVQQFSEERINRDDVWEFMKRVEVCFYLHSSSL